MVLGQMKRREFISLLGAAAWPLAARAQQRKTALIGVLSGRSPDESAQLMAAFHEGLGETGYFAGKNLTIEYRWAEGREDRLPGLAAELVNREVVAIAAVGGANSALAAKRATSTIPIVFSSGADPVRLGLVASLNRPGGNVTGVAQFGLIAKRLELMNELVPTGVSIAFLSNPHYPNADDRSREAQKAGRALGREVVILNAGNEREIDVAFANLAQRKQSALLVDNVALFNNRRQQIVALAARYAVPACYELRDSVVAGGLVSYGANLADGYRQIGIYTGRILNGEKPADLPVMQPTKFALVINLKTANALGLTIPPTLLARADEVIE